MLVFNHYQLTLLENCPLLNVGDMHAKLLLCDVIKGSTVYIWVYMK